MRHFLARFSGSDASCRMRYSAAFITSACESEFSVHTTSVTAACRLNSVTLGGRSGEELVQRLLKGIFSRLPGRCCSVEIDR